MNIFWRTLLVLLLIALGPRPALNAAEAIVEKDRINVRGQPSVSAEVVAQLRKGTTVTILEEVPPVGKTEPGDPKRWARIALPTNSHAWVNGSFIDPTNKTVVPKRLNVRAGPSENYSVIGRLDRGTPVVEIRSQNGWMEIAPPANAYAFVGLELLGISTNVPPMETATAAAPTAAPPLESAKPPPVTAEEPIIKPVEQPPVEPAAKPEPNPPVAAAPVAAAPATVPDALAIPATANTNLAAGGVAATEPLPKRIVRREGVVRRTSSIQAPTYFELENTETGKTMNYLHTTAPGINLREYRGYRIAVTGEEYLDVRWRTPVIEVETLQVIP